MVDHDTFAEICVPLGLVQVQTQEEPEPDLNFGSLLLRFRFAKFRELDLKPNEKCVDAM
jgi:hypothetical protein